MKKLLLLSVIVLFSVYAGNLFAAPTPVKVFSSNFSVGGSASCEEPYCPSYFEDSYNESGFSPLSREIVATWWQGGNVASSSADYFSVHAIAASAPSASAYARTELTFSPLSMMDNLAIHAGPLMGMAFSSYNVKVEDLTYMSDIFSVSGSSEDLWSVLDIDDDLAYLIEHPFQTDHRYKLSFYVDSGAQFDIGELSLWTNDLIAGVPEPATMLLLGLGLVGFAGVKRKWKN